MCPYSNLEGSFLNAYGMSALHHACSRLSTLVCHIIDSTALANIARRIFLLLLVYQNAFLPSSDLLDS